MAGIGPSAEHDGIAFEFVAHDGIELGHGGHAGLDQFTHGHGAGDAFLIIAVFDGIGQANRFYIRLQIRDKIPWQVVGEEQIGDAGFGELDEDGIGCGEQSGLAIAIGEAIGMSKAGLFGIDGTGGAGDVLEV